jgi:transposase
MEKVQFDQVVKVGCGIDVHKDNIVATVRRSEEKYETREFSSFTSSLTELREWCKSEGVTHIAMESTGVYWKPVFNILEEGDFEIILVNARHVRNVPGHKTDKKDSQWLSKLLLSGLLKASFIPPVEIRDLRDLVRYKKKVVAQASSEKNRIIRILEDANIKLSSVLTNVDGAVGSRIIDDLIAGKTNVEGLMEHYHGQIKASREEFRKALQGRLTKHHQFMLRVLKESITDKEKLIGKLDNQIDELAKQYAVEIELLQTIPGVAYDSAVGIISEIGADMKQFSSEQHLSSWAGMSPGNNESGGKKKSAKTIHGNAHLQATLAESAWGATRKKDSYLKRKYQSLVARCGKKKAIVAVEHKIIIAAYHVIKNKEAYKEPVLYNNPKRKAKQINSLLSRLNELGVVVKQVEMA